MSGASTMLVDEIALPVVLVALTASRRSPRDAAGKASCTVPPRNAEPPVVRLASSLTPASGGCWIM